MIFSHATSCFQSTSSAIENYDQNKFVLFQQETIDHFSAESPFMTASLMWNIQTNIQILELDAIPNANTVKLEIKRIIENKQRIEPHVAIKLKRSKKLSIKKKKQKRTASMIADSITTSI